MIQPSTNSGNIEASRTAFARSWMV